MRKERVWACLLGLERTVVESVEIDEEGHVVVAVRPHHRERDRCGVCGRRAPGFELMPDPRSLHPGAEIVMGYASGVRRRWTPFGRRPGDQGFGHEARSAEEIEAHTRWCDEFERSRRSPVRIQSPTPVSPA